MAGLFAILLAVALGCVLVFRFANLISLQPRWAAALVIFGSGTALGIGLTSILFLVALLLIPGLPSQAMWVEIGVLVWVSYDLFRRPDSATPTEPPRQFPWNLMLMAALILALTLVITAMSGAWENNPQGNWDAWAIWNLRARFLAAGGSVAHRAWSPLLGSTHPEYPLLTSAFVARAWTYSHTLSDATPIAVSCLFFLALISLATGGMAAWRSGPLGLLLGFSLAATATLVHVVPDQYADIPLACYITGALILAFLERPVLAGLLAGLAAWTKDEGLLFVAVFLAAATIFRRQQLPRLVVGAALGGAVAVFFKTVLARGNASLLSTSLPLLGQHLSDPSRYRQVVVAMGDQFTNMAVGWYHPILPALSLAIALRFDIQRRRDVLFCSTVALFLLIGYFAVYIITPNDLTWQLQTSLSRLYVQLWPILLLAVFAALRTPESTGVTFVEAPPKSSKEKRKARA
jgi:hypothetical protein